MNNVSFRLVVLGQQNLDVSYFEIFFKPYFRAITKNLV